jgi:hypothetical protein
MVVRRIIQIPVQMEPSTTIPLTIQVLVEFRQIQVKTAPLQAVITGQIPQTNQVAVIRIHLQ